MTQIKRFRLHDYSSEWVTHFQKIATHIRQALGEVVLDIQHIGSTSVPGLCAKEDIDVLCVVKTLSESKQLETVGFKFRGELNIPLRYFFNANQSDLPKVNLHVCEPGHGFINLNLAFRDALRSDTDLRDAYAELKRRLVQNPESFHRTPQGFVRYTLDKDAFIKRVLRHIGFDGFVVNYCMHDNEWAAYHHLKETALFQPNDLEYDRNHPSIYGDQYRHLVMYKGVDIAAAAHIETVAQTTLILRAFVVDLRWRKQGVGAYFMRFIESWCCHHGYKNLQLHAAPEASVFYEKLGYAEMSFDDVSAFDGMIKMGKFLEGRQ